MKIFGGDMITKVYNAVGMDESIPITKDGDDLLISFNPKFLIDILKVLDQEEVSMFFTNPKAPCFIKDEEGSYIYIVLPVVQ